MSSIGWVDFSSEHREKVKSVIDLLSTPGVIDELGIGVIRDSFSDSLFPGISTIQIRAKYFLTVPRIVNDYEKHPPHKRRRWKLAEYLNDHENLCMNAMVENHRDDPQDGIIGESFTEIRERLMIDLSPINDNAEHESLAVISPDESGTDGDGRSERCPNP